MQYFQTHHEMTSWQVAGSWLPHHPWLRLLHETIDYFEFFFFSLSFWSLEQFYSKGKSVLPDSASSVPVVKTITFSGITQHVTLSPPVLWFSSQCSWSSTMTCLHWETQSSWALQWVYVNSSSVIQGGWWKGRSFLLSFINGSVPVFFVTASCKPAPLFVMALLQIFLNLNLTLQYLLIQKLFI